MVDQTLSKEIEQLHLRENPNREKTTSREAINSLYQRWYKKNIREVEEERVTTFSAALNLTFTMKPRKYNIFICIFENPIPLSVSRREKAQTHTSQ